MRRIAETIGGSTAVTLILFALFALSSDPTDILTRILTASGCIAAAWVLYPRRWIHE